VVTTVGGWPGIPGSADGLGAAARFNFPSGIAVDSAGNPYVADTDNNTIRVGRMVDAGPVFLQIEKEGAQIVLSWPASSGDFQLEKSTDLGTSWQQLTNPPVLSGTDSAVTNDIVGAAAFFRLRRL